ncbi:MAG: hypothetical protein DLM53_04400 [Candidatus Eremiobacter antarcticus]|nr:methionine gamma-lyase family protein [Candidatus Eremiobacteraeota bacterium]MBC5807979.1 methionine gamma-lyase family protein [Candidatus Eremiobacteraeota bacterium]PZR62660.1 MAG: hypothetical protein DLM53_04400 [Candidatus Eremiobacter sp. RRmetagenome_bin22]
MIQRQLPLVQAAFERAAERFGFSQELIDQGRCALGDVETVWARWDAHGIEAGAKVFQAFQRAALTEAHLAGTTGYGYHDAGRDAYERLLADVLQAESAFARLQLVSGTHAIVASITALLGASGRLCSITGPPYDTLRKALVEPLGAAAGGGSPRYREARWAASKPDAGADSQAASDVGLDEASVSACLRDQPEVIFIQRSRGYSPRPSMRVRDIAALIATCKQLSPQSLIVVDNCYGELVELEEPTAAGADVIVGSLIKNLGGGIAPGGAYIAGRGALVAAIADHVFAPGLGLKVGPTFEASRALFAGLHRAPRAVCESLKSLEFAAALFERLGYAVDPQVGGTRTDIIQAVRLGDARAVTAFAEGLQRFLAVNSHARPEPGPVPGYDDPVLMAGGSFVGGSTMELSCDAPMRPPFDMYLQGGTDCVQGILATMNAAAHVMRARA